MVTIIVSFVGGSRIACPLIVIGPDRFLSPSTEWSKAQCAHLRRTRRRLRKRLCAQLLHYGDAFLPSLLSGKTQRWKWFNAHTFVLLACVIHSEPRYCSERRGSAFSGASGSMAKSKIPPSAKP